MGLRNVTVFIFLKMILFPESKAIDFLLATLLLSLTASIRFPDCPPGPNRVSYSDLKLESLTLISLSSAMEPSQV